MTPSPEPVATSPVPAETETFGTALEEALTRGLNQSYGTNAGSMQRHYGKTPGSVYNDQQVPFPVVTSTNMENIGFLGTTRFNTPLHEFKPIQNVD